MFLNRRTHITEQIFFFNFTKCQAKKQSNLTCNIIAETGTELVTQIKKKKKKLHQYSLLNQATTAISTGERLTREGGTEVMVTVFSGLSQGVAFI